MKKYYKFNALFPFGIYAVFSEEGFDKLAKERNLIGKLPKNCLGAVNTWHYEGIGSIIVVFINVAHKQNKNKQELNGTIVHEATHVVQRLFDLAGEKSPGEETRAYLTEYIVQMISSLLETAKKDGKRTTRRKRST